MRHYCLKGAVAPSRPALLFDVLIDFQDPRSGYRSSDSGLFKAQWLADESKTWSRDMVARLRRDWLEQFTPPSQPPWPAVGDETLIRFLVEFYRPAVWRNYALRLYSSRGESREEFLARCRAALEQERSESLRRRREIFLHRFFELEQRALAAAVEEDTLDDDIRLQRQGRTRNLFNDGREDLSRWFLSEDYRRTTRPLDWTLEFSPGLQDRLDGLRADLLAGYQEVTADFEKEASSIEAYEVAVTGAQIEIVTRSILWE